LTEEIFESTQEEIREVEGHYVPDGSQREHIFYPAHGFSAYFHMLDFINFAKPESFNVVCAKDQSGDIVAVKLTYLRSK